MIGNHNKILGLCGQQLYLDEMFLYESFDILGEESFTTLKLSCDKGIKLFKSPLEPLGEQWLIIDCRLFNIFQATCASVHFSCSNISLHWGVILLEFSSLLVPILIAFKFSLEQSFKVSSTKRERELI